MKALEETAERLIMGIRSRASLGGVVFIHAYSPEKLPFPIDRYFAAVSTDKAQRDSFVSDQGHALFSGVMKIRVYAPNDTDGCELFGLCASMLDALVTEGRDVLSETWISEIRYDTKAKTVYREISAQMDLISGVSA